MEITFLYLMVGLKLPIAALLYLCWWAVKQVPEPEDATDGEDGDGGSKVPPHPRPSSPPRPRRGPHGTPPPATPKRTRTTVARGRPAKTP